MTNWNKCDLKLKKRNFNMIALTDAPLLTVEFVVEAAAASLSVRSISITNVQWI